MVNWRKDATSVIKAYTTKEHLQHQKLMERKGRYVVYPLPHYVKKDTATKVLKILKKQGVSGKFIAGNILMSKTDLRRKMKKKRKRK